MKPDNTPTCDKCGLEITTGFMAFFCPRGSECELWPRDSPLDVQLLAYKHWEAEMKARLAEAAPFMVKPSAAPASAEGWFLRKKKVNSLQADSIDALIHRCKHAHYVDVVVRVDGKDEHYQVDWLKHLSFQKESKRES